MRGHELQEDGEFERERRQGYTWACVSLECTATLHYWRESWFGQVLRQPCGAEPVTRTRRERE